MLCFSWPRFFLRFSIPSVFLSVSLRIAPSAPATIGYHCHPHVQQFNKYFDFTRELKSSLVRSKYLFYFFAFFNFYSVIRRNCKIYFVTSSFFFFFFFFLLISTRTGLLVEIGCSVCIPKSQVILCISLSTTDSCLCIYQISSKVKFQFLARFLVDRLSHPDMSTLLFLLCFRSLCGLIIKFRLD